MKLLPRVDTIRAVALLLVAVPSLFQASPLREDRDHHHRRGGRNNRNNQPHLDREITQFAGSMWPEPLSRLSNHRHSINNERTTTESSDSNTYCPECNKRKQEKTLSAEELKQMRIEMIKKQILSKLKLSHPPRVNVTQRPKLPDPLEGVAEQALKEEHHLNTGTDRSKDDFFGKTTEVVVFGNEGRYIHVL